MQVQSPGEGNGNPLQYCCWKIPWTKEPGGLQSMDTTEVTQNNAKHYGFIENVFLENRYRSIPR